MISLTCLRIFTAVRTPGWAAWVWVLLLSTSKESRCCHTTTGQLVVLFLTLHLQSVLFLFCLLNVKLNPSLDTSFLLPLCVPKSSMLNVMAASSGSWSGSIVISKRAKTKKIVINMIVYRFENKSQCISLNSLNR